MVPILYSQHDCPHCIRARLALAYADLPFELRSFAAEELPALSDNGADVRLPVLEIVPGEYLRASGDILHWALLKHDPDGLMDYEVDVLDAMHDLIRINDGSFAQDVAHYRAGQGDRDKLRADCALFLDGLEGRLQQQRYLFAERESFADLALFPFVHQYAQADPTRFAQAHYPKLQRWLEDFGNRNLYRAVMRPVAPWQQGQEPTLFSPPAG